MMLHADGPWQVAPYRDHPNGPIYILDSTGKTAIAQVIAGRIDGTGMANAHLIKASPVLLKALKQCLLVLAGEELNKFSLENAMKAGLDAIKEATNAEPA
jgi:hypothetical protein